MMREARLAVLGLLCAGAGMADEPLVFMGVARQAPELGPLVFQANRTSSPMTRDEMAAQLDARLERGSGADVGGLELIQVLYGDPAAGNKVDLFWLENSENPAGVGVSLDGKLLGTAPGLPAGELPGLNRANVTKVPAGPHTFKVEAEGTTSEASLTILDLKPFSEPEGLQCKSNGFVSPDTGFCGMEVSWTIPGEEPEFINLWIDRVFQDSFPGGQRKVFFAGLPAGPYEVAIRAFKAESPTSLYGGDFHFSNCDIECEDVPCNAVSNLEICQIHYGAEAPGNQLQLQWFNGETAYAGGVNAYIDGVLSVSGGPDANLAILGNLEAGDRTIGIEGDCGPDGKATITEAVFPVKDETPHPNPITGALQCEFDAANSRTTVSWTPADPSGGVLVYVTREPDPRVFVGRAFPSNPRITINGTIETDTISLIFLEVIDDVCYGSEVFSCTAGSAGPQYVQGLCNGEGAAPSITSAIFGLNHLFLSGPAPPCQKACDVDGNGAFNITDMVYLLNFLFLSGPSPTLWGGPNPACTAATPEDDCEIPNPACPL